MRFLNVTRALGIVLLIVLLVTIYVVNGYLNKDIISEAQDTMMSTLARYISPEIKELARKQVQTRLIEEAEAQTSVIFWGKFTRWGSTASLLMGLTCMLLVSAGGYYKLTTHRLRTRYSEIEYRGNLDPNVAAGLVIAEQLESRNTEAAVNLYLKMAEVNTRQLQALSKGIPAITPPQSQSQALPETTTAPIGDVPTFAQLLERGEIAPGKPLVIGYTQDGKPYRSTLSDNYSTIVIGQSGTGKTFGEAYGIAQTVLSYGAYYTILDPHYPDPKKESLGDRLGALTSLDNIEILNNPYILDEYTDRLTSDFEAIIKTGVGHTPHIIVVDEHSLWKSSTNGGKGWLKFEERVIYEGRKYGWYLHATSKSPLACDFGSSAVRDSFKTSLMYKVKKHQAATYFKDPELVELSQKCKRPGMAVYTDIQDVSQIVHVPRIQQEDMNTVASLVRQANGSPIAYSAPQTCTQDVQIDAQDVAIQNVNNEPKQAETPVETGGNSKKELMVRLKDATGKSQNELAEMMGISRKDMSFFLNKNTLSDEKKRFVETAFFSLCDANNIDYSDCIETPETPEETGRNNIIDAAKRFQEVAS